MNRRVATVLTDALFIMLLVLIILPHEPARKADPVVDLFAPMLVGARWPDGFETDVDLWVKAPGDRFVGYSRLRGDTASLLRDDLGNMGADPVWRFEVAAFVRLPDGEYAISVHLYSDKGGNAPVPVDVLVWRKTPDGYSELYRGAVVLEKVKDQITVIRFTVRDQEIVSGSLHTTPLPIQ